MLPVIYINILGFRHLFSCCSSKVFAGLVVCCCLSVCFGLFCFVLMINFSLNISLQTIIFVFNENSFETDCSANKIQLARFVQDPVKLRGTNY